MLVELSSVLLGAIAGAASTEVARYVVYRRRRLVSAMLIREDLYALQDQIAGDMLREGVFIFDRIVTQMRHTEEDFVRFGSRRRRAWHRLRGWSRLPADEWFDLCRVLRHGRDYLARETVERQALIPKGRDLLKKLYEDTDQSRRRLHQLDGLGDKPHAFFDDVMEAFAASE